MFRNLPPATFGATEADSRVSLHKLAEKMNGGDDTAQDGHDAEESGIPALYTYFGQFIDHDITFDPVSTLTKALDPLWTPKIGNDPKPDFALRDLVRYGLGLGGTLSYR